MEGWGRKLCDCILYFVCLRWTCSGQYV